MQTNVWKGKKKQLAQMLTGLFWWRFIATVNVGQGWTFLLILHLARKLNLNVLILSHISVLVPWLKFTRKTFCRPYGAYRKFQLINKKHWNSFIGSVLWNAFAHTVTAARQPSLQIISISPKVHVHRILNRIILLIKWSSE